MIVAAMALVAIVAWPFIGAGNRARASLPPPAVVLPDYSHRDQTVAFLEKKARGDKQDQITARMLAAQYMQRYRENGDVDDIKRAIAQGKRSLALQPQNSSAADEVLGSAYTALHKFREALKYEAAAHLDQPYDSNAPAQMASLDMELGNYPAAARDLVIARKIANSSTVESVQARYDELTGNLPEARTLIQQGMVEMDAVIDNSAQGRAWFHFRAGELAFSAGAIDEAKADERYALTQFPNFELAYRALARFCWATKDWRCALDAAAKGVAITPLPETLGYEADAQKALGDAAGAQQTQALIFAIERIGNAYRLSDRLLSVYYSEHGIRLDDSLKIAQREVAVRGDEIYAQDTLAWAAAMDGRWDIARRAAERAIRFNTADPRIHYHAGMIALHFGEKDEAKRRLQEALGENPQFDPFYADEARAQLAKL